MLDDSRRAGSLGAPTPVVLMIVGLFDGKQLFIREQNSLPVQRCEATKESSTSFQSYTLVVSSQKLNTMELARLELKLLFDYLEGRFARDTGFTSNFSHRHCRISLDAFFDHLVVPSDVAYSLSATSQAETGVAEILEPFDGPTDIWRGIPSFCAISQLRTPCSCNTKIMSD